MRRLRWILPLLLLAVGGWFYWSPRHAWDRFLTALVTAQPEELEATIDFPILRENLKRDLGTAFRTRVRIDAPGAGALGNAILDRAVETAITPLGLERLVTAFGTRVPQPGDVDSARVGTATAYHYHGLSEVDIDVWPRGGTPADGGIFTFERSGLGWRLVRIWSDRLAGKGTI